MTTSEMLKKTEKLCSGKCAKEWLKAARAKMYPGGDGMVPYYCTLAIAHDDMDRNNLIADAAVSVIDWFQAQNRRDIRIAANDPFTPMAELPAAELAKMCKEIRERRAGR